MTAPHSIQRALVTGGAGFVGKHLVKALRAAGVETLILDMRAVDGSTIEGSVTDPATAARAVKGIDTVFHLAGIADLWRPDETAFGDVNRDGTFVMLEAAKAAGVRKFVQCSSLTTLVSKTAPIGPSTANETLVVDPDDLLGAYPRSKREADLLVLEAAAAGLDACVVLPTEPLGAGDDSITPPTQMMLDFLNGNTPAYIDCVLNFVPVESLAAGFIAAAEKGRRGERYLLGGENVPMRRLLDLLQDMSGRRMPKTSLPYAVALIAGLIDTKLIAAITHKAPKAPLTGVRLAGRRVTFDSSKAERELGWTASPVAPALKEMVDWAVEKGLASF